MATLWDGPVSSGWLGCHAPQNDVAMNIPEDSEANIVASDSGIISMNRTGATQCRKAKEISAASNPEMAVAVNSNRINVSVVAQEGAY